MRSILKSYWYFSAYFHKHAKLIAFAVVIGIILFAVILPFVSTLPQVKPTQYIGVVGSYDFNTLPREITRLISRGLTQVDEEGNPLPDLSERWSVEDDGKTYRLIIKENIRWQDGKILEPKDIRWEFENTQTIYTENEIVFKLPEPFAPFPVLLSQPLFRETQGSYFRFFTKKRIVGLAPYHVSKLKYQDNRLQEMILDSVQERRIYRFYLTEDRAKTAFQQGRIDQISGLTAVDDFPSWPNVQVKEEIHTDQYLAVFFNHDDPLFSKNVRQALAYALQRNENSLRAKGPINPNSWAYLDSVKAYPYDLERATERILDEIPAQPMNFTLTTTARFGKQAEEIEQQWEEFGRYSQQACQKSSAIKEKERCDNLLMDVNVVISNFPDLDTFQTLLVGQQIPRDPDQYGLWHSTQPTNFSRYKNPRIDALLENGRKITDLTDRTAIYQEFQQFLLEDSPAIFLYYLTDYQVMRK